MQMFIKKKIGKTHYNFVVEGDNLFKLVLESQKLSFPDVTNCGNCGSDELYLNARFAGDKDQYEYTEIRCRNCKSNLQFGQTKKDKDVFFLRKVSDGRSNNKLDWRTHEQQQGDKTDNSQNIPNGPGSGPYVHE